MPIYFILFFGMGEEGHQWLMALDKIQRYKFVRMILLIIIILMIMMMLIVVIILIVVMIIIIIINEKENFSEHLK